MADYSSTNEPSYKSRLLKPQSTAFSVSEVVDESLVDPPNKPNQRNDLRMQGIRTNDHALMPISNKLPSQTPHAQTTQDFLVVKAQALAQGVMSEYLAGGTTKAFQNSQNWVGDDKTEEIVRDRKSSINSYNKRVVELNLGHVQSQKNIRIDSNLKGSVPSTMRAKNSSKMSMDYSNTSNAYDHTKGVSGRSTVQNKSLKFDYSQDKGNPNGKMFSPVEMLSPKGGVQIFQNAYSSPKQFLTSPSTASLKNKMVIRKQAPHSKPIGGKACLNKSDQVQFSMNTTQEAASRSIINVAGGVRGSKQNSPCTKNTLIQASSSRASKQNSRKKNQGPIGGGDIHQSVEKQKALLKPCLSTRDIHSLKTQVEQGITTLRHVNSQLRLTDGGQQSKNKCSPSQMTLNKALTRISSVGELKKIKDQIQSQRNSVQLATPKDYNAKTQEHRKTGFATESEGGDLSQIGIQADKQDDEDNDYITNQEKLWSAIETRGSLKQIIELLNESDVSVDAKNVFDDGWTALHYAVHEGYFEVVKFLLENYDASVEARSSTNKTPFHLACIRGEEKLIKYMISRGANSCSVDRDGSTPLHYLCETENHEMIRYLLPISDNSKDVRNRFGKKPVDLVQDSEIKKLIRNFKPRRNSSQSNSRGRLSGTRNSLGSRERQGQGLKTNITIQNVSQERAGDMMNQLFKKFSLYKRHQINLGPGHQPRPAVQTSLQKVNRDLQGEPQQRDTPTFSKDQPPKTSRQSQQVVSSKANQSALRNKPSAFNVNTTQTSSRMSTQLSPRIQTQPQSCKNSTKAQDKKKIMFPTTSSNIMIGKTSPSSQNIIGRQSNPFSSQQKSYSKQPQNGGQKPKTQALTNSQSQRDLGPKPEVRRMTTAASVRNLICPSQKQLSEEKAFEKRKLVINIDDGEDDGEEPAEPTPQPAETLVQKIKNSLKTQEEQVMTCSQRTVESSQLMQNNHDSRDLLKTRANLTLSIKQQDCEESSESQREETPVATKIGPQSFVAHQLLGTGSFGEVFLVEKISSQKYYAMKVLSKAKIMGHNLTRYAMTERNVLSIANHPFIVNLNFAFQTAEKLFLILDYCPGGDLAEYLQLEKRFNEDKTRLYSSEILLALEELHRKDIIFRDLKPDNVVLDSEGHALLTDFGLSKEGVMKEGMAKSFCGSYAYLAPEMLKKQGHGKPVDWYLLGVIIYEMLCGIPPYYANNKEELFENIKQAPLEFPAYVSATARDLLMKLLNRNPKKRLGTISGADEIKRHPFFKVIDWTKLYNRCYKPPEPYLKKRFENFLQLSPSMQTNAEVYEKLKRENNLLKMAAEQHISGWSFVSPSKQNE